MPIEHRVWNPPRGKRRRRRHRRCACRNPFLTLKAPNPRRRRRHRRGRRNPTGIPFSGAVYRPRRRGHRPRYTRWRRGLSRHAFGRFPRFRGRGLYRLARALAPRGGRRKLARRCKRTRGCRRRGRR